MAIKIVTDSSCDLPISYLEENKDIFYILPCYIDMDNKTYVDDFGVSYDLKTFYDRMRNGGQPKTSMVVPNRFIELYTKLTDDGDEVIYIGFSGPLSGVHSSSTLAAREVMKSNPNAKIYIVDTLSASVGLGVCIYESIKRIREGQSAEQVVEYLESTKQKVNHWFGVDDLGFLKRGGRISPTVALIGTALNIKPTLTIDREGNIVPFGKVRGRKKSIHLLAEKTVASYDKEQSSIIGIGHGDCSEDAAELKRLVSEQLPEAIIYEVMLPITIATHVGPGTLAIAFVGAEREG